QTGKTAKKKEITGPDFEEMIEEMGPEKRVVKFEFPLLPILGWIGAIAIMIAGGWQLLNPKEKVVAQPTQPGGNVPPAYVPPVEEVPPPAGIVQQEQPPAYPHDLTIGPAEPLLSYGLVRRVSELGTAQATIEAAQPGDVVVFDREEIEDVLLESAVTNVQFIGGTANWTIKADMVECQFFWHSPLTFKQESGRLDHCAFYRSHGPATVLNHADAVSMYYGGQEIDPSGTDYPQVQFKGFARGVTVHKPVLKPRGDELKWDMAWPPVFHFNCTDTNSPGYHSQIISPLTVNQTAWTPIQIMRGVGVTVSHVSTIGNVWANPVVDINYGIDCVLLGTAFGGVAANAGYLRQPDKIQYAKHQEWGHNSPYSPFRGAVARVGGQRNRLIGIGGLHNWSVGPRRNLPGLHYGDGILARDPFLQEWSAEGAGFTMNFADSVNVFRLDWSYRAAPEVKSTGTNANAAFPLLGPNVPKPIFVQLQDIRSAPPLLDGVEVKDFTGREGADIVKALNQGEYVFLGQGAYEFDTTITNGLIFGAGMDRTLVTWPTNIDCAARNCRGLINLTVKGGKYGYNSQAGAGGKTNTADALILRTRFEEQQESAINVHAFADQVYQGCEFVNCRNAVTVGRLRGSTVWMSARGKRPGLRVKRLNFANCRFRKIRERAIDLVMSNEEGMVAIQNCIFEEVKGQAVRILGGKSHLIQGCKLTEIGFPGSQYAALQVNGHGIVTLSHLEFENPTDAGAPLAIAVEGIPTISHCTFGGYYSIVQTRNPLVMDHCIAEDARLDLPFGSLVFKSTFENADVGKGVMEVVSVDNFKSLTLQAKVQPLDITPPPVITTVRIAPRPDGTVLQWNGVHDPESGVAQYLIYANGKLVASTPLEMSMETYRNNPFHRPNIIVQYTDHTPDRPEYEVRAVNGANLIADFGQAPIRAWGPLRPKFRTREGKETFIADIEYNSRRRILRLKSSTLESIDLRNLERMGAPYSLIVDQGPYLESTEQKVALGVTKSAP
ncbi:MAG: right-handed parallel beta-helix repeat-containing protein, partial [Limisphaerales bacterium]